MSERSIAAVLKAHSAELMSLPGVVGTAQGLCANRPCINVYVEKKDAGPVAKIPVTIEGYPVRIEETGTFRALQNKE